MSLSHYWDIWDKILYQIFLVASFSVSVYNFEFRFSVSGGNTNYSRNIAPIMNGIINYNAINSVRIICGNYSMCLLDIIILWWIYIMYSIIAVLIVMIYHDGYNILELLMVVIRYLLYRYK